ncbi:hypothetical protein H6G97_20930 [Nostoc flagelliforme FACHB-838]|uniref:Uncharacterized protein n=1 Tax=Nostoc flagelliforme FACHB-838 TaxID=2692904 RepID=A0ABR8DUJ2_9NOSO|nr:hypothetical protein [Nostoc flagelliforme]MBD2531915.1 hypothetical protein [Nostoc flagelliforme FACHB-838]
MKYDRIVLSDNAEVDGNKKIELTRQLVGRLAFKYRQQIVATTCTLFTIFQSSSAKAQSIFSGAQSAMTCIVTSASQGGVTNALFQALPSILFTSLTLVIFGYFIYTVVQSVSAYGRGEEVTHVVQQPLFTFVFVIIIFVFQSLLFGANNAGCTQ